MTADGIVTVVVVGVFLGLFYGPWQDLCADYARQYVFEQRDALFDMAASGRLDFSSREYRDTRQSMEAVIRFAHDLTLPRLVYLVAAHRGQTADGARASISKSRLPADIKDDISIRLFKTYKTVLLMMAARSLVVLLLCPVALIAIGFSAAFSMVKLFIITAIKRAGELIQFEANGSR